MDWEGADEIKVEGRKGAPQEQDTSSWYPESVSGRGPRRRNSKIHDCITPVTLLPTLETDICVAFDLPGLLVF
jgi:hypothetical protein